MTKTYLLITMCPTALISQFRLFLPPGDVPSCTVPTNLRPLTAQEAPKGYFTQLASASSGPLHLPLSLQ